MENKELRRCPFCGSTATVAEVRDYDGSLVWEVSCDACSNAIDWSFETEAEAVEAWNRRNGNGEKTVRRII